MREDVSSTRDGFSAWAKADPETILRRYVVDAKGFFPALREAPARRHEPSSQEYRFLRRCAQQLDRTEKAQRLPFGTLNLDVEKELSKGILRENWYIITPQEASEYLEHDFLTNRFHVTHCGGMCDIVQQGYFLFGTSRCRPSISTTPGLVEQDKIKEGESGWVLQGVVSRAAFPRQPCSVKKSFTVMSLHINNNYAKKAWHREEASPHYPRRDAGRARGHGHW